MNLNTPVWWKTGVVWHVMASILAQILREYRGGEIPSARFRGDSLQPAKAFRRGGYSHE